MNGRLNELAVKYKQTKSQTILAEIFKLLEKTIKKKVDYVFYKQRFFIDEKLKLCDTKKIDKDDVEQELKLEIIELLERYDDSKKFEPFFLASKWNWKPKFINKDFMKDLEIISIYQKNKEGEDINIVDSIPAPESEMEELINYDEMFENLTIIEKLIINILRKNSNATQQQIADIIGVTHQRIDQYLKKIRKKFIKPLQN